MAEKNIIAKWKFKKIKRQLVPPSDFLSKLQPLHIGMWCKNDDDWKCPVCERDKFSIVSYNQNHELIYIVYNIK